MFLWRAVPFVPGFSPGHLGVRAPYALHYEPYALISALRFTIRSATRCAHEVRAQAFEIRVCVCYTPYYTCVVRSSSVVLSGLVIGRLHYCVGLVGDFPTGNS